jgi:chaperonin GroES
MFQPLRNRILCQLIPGQHATAEGIILPESGPERSLRYRVIAVGPECRSVKAGDTIMLPLYAGQDMEVEGALCTITREPEVSAITQ